ncbi:MAG TPA: hypothetical protein PKN12_04330 [Bacteroidales bacterium]|nr:hypothetical protein [Bacteroidales bacterium]HPT10145.1 hypothetical protein [Bacteroidales bacterium]
MRQPITPMICRTRYPFHLPFLVLLTGFLFVSCEKFTGDQEIPAYLSVDSIYLSTDYSKQGTNSQNITDVWVYVDDEFLGAYELPARFPVLKSGTHAVKMWPGVKKNGISATRIAYEYYTPIQRNINFKEDSTSAAGILKTTYQTPAFFAWLEDFESAGLSLDTTQRSTAYIDKTPAGSPLTFQGSHSGIVRFDSIHDFLEVQTHEIYPIPLSSVFLEMNFNTTNTVTVGVITYGISTLAQTPIITLNRTNGVWKKIYIDLTTTLNAYTGMNSFRVYLGTFKDSDHQESMLLFDNFKIVTRKTN